MPMDDDILSELSSDFSPFSPDAGAAGAPASSADGDSVGEGGEPSGETPPEGGNLAQEKPPGDDGQSGEKPPEEAPLDLSKLEALAKERRGAREQKPAEPEAKPEPLTADAIAQAMRSTDTFREQVTAAVAKGDLAALARLTSRDPEKADPASIYERFTKNALDPSGASAADELAALRAKVAELEGKALPDNVLTTEALQQMRQEEAYARNRQEFLSIVADAEKHPILANIDESLRLQYGGEAQALIEEAGQTPTTELLARIAEQVASSKLGGLVARNTGAAAETQSGSSTPKAAGAATAGETSGRGAIDNRAASTTAATMPAPDDDEAWEQRLLSVASGARTH